MAKGCSSYSAYLDSPRELVVMVTQVFPILLIFSFGTRFITAEDLNTDESGTEMRCGKSEVDFLFPHRMMFCL
jgi:hypothetical protein